MPGREQTVPIGEDAPVLEVLRTMRAMRRLAPDPVPDEVLERIVEAATWAPSGGNVQAFHYVVVTDRERMARLAELWRVVCDYYLATFANVRPETMDEGRYERLKDALRFQRDHFHETPAVIVACYDAGPWTRRLMGEARRFATQTARLGPRRLLTTATSFKAFGDRSLAASVYPGVQNLLIAARAHGLGATLTTWHLMLEPEFKAALDIPGRVQTYAIVPVGWPLGRMGPVVRRSVADVLHRDAW